MTDLRLISGAGAEANLVEAAELAAFAWDVAPVGDELVRELAAPDALVLGAFAGGALVGVTRSTWGGGAVATSDETVVVRSWRGRGLAGRLLDGTLDLLRARGVREVHGQSSARRPRSLAVMLRYGFRIVGVELARTMPGFADGTLVYRTRLTV